MSFPAKTALSTFVTIHPQETRLVYRLLLHSFMVGLTTSVFFVVANGYFLQEAGVTQLPLTYMGAGVVGMGLVALYRKAQNRLGVLASYQWVLGFMAAFSLLLFILYIQLPAHTNVSFWLACAGFGMVYPLSALIIIGFAQTHNLLFSLEQMRRLGSFTGVGEVAASVLGYLTIPVLLQLGMPVIVLYPISAGLALFSLIPLRGIEKMTAKESVSVMNAPVVKEDAPARNKAFPFSIGLFSFCMVILVYVSDYAYLLAVKQLSDITAVKAAILVAYLFSIIKAGEFAISLISGRLLNRFGLSTSLWLLPVIGLCLCGAAGVSLLLFTQPMIFIIMFLLLNKVVERIMRKGVIQPVLKVIYQAAPLKERLHLQSNLEGTINQVACISAGAMLYVMVRLSQNSTNAGLVFFKEAIALLVLAGLLWLLATRRLLHSFALRIKSLVQTSSLAPRAPNASIEPIAAAQNPLLGQATALVARAGTPETIAPLLQRYMQAPLDHPSLLQAPYWTQLYLRESYPFFRQLLLKLLPHFTENERRKAVFAVLSASSAQMQLWLLETIAQPEPPVPGQEMQALPLEQTAAQIFWLMGLCYDAKTMQYDMLVKQMEPVLNTMKQLLLAQLATMYGTAHLPHAQVLLHAGAGTEEQYLFALELLEANLDPAYSSMIIPLFQPLPFGSLQQKMKPWFPPASNAARHAPTDWMMADYHMVEPAQKLLFLETAPVEWLGAPLLAALRSSSWPVLQQQATARALKQEDMFLTARRNAAAQLHAALATNYTFLAYGTQAQLVTQKSRANRWNGHDLLLTANAQNIICYADALAAAMLFAHPDSYMGVHTKKPELQVAAGLV